MKATKDAQELYRSLMEDERIDLLHLGVFISLYYWWVQNKYHNPFAVTPDLVMKTSKVKILHCYQKCMKELHEYGYITYTASLHPELGSTVIIHTTNKK